MIFRRIIVLFLASTFHFSFSQSVRIDKFGEPTEADFKLNQLQSEPEAPGVILYESGNYYAVSIVRRNAVRLVKEIHRKIKVFDAKKFNFTTIEIPYFVQNEYFGEEILDYKAITHNGATKHFVPTDAFYKTQSGPKKNLIFTFPNVQNGSILEYRFTIVSPYFFDLDGWEFQNEIPTLYSLFQTSLPINIKYNRILYGNKKMDINNTWIKKDAFLVPSNNWHIDTEVSIYSMSNIPSFTEEDYMLSRKNYISRIVFEPLSFTSFAGFDFDYTRSWEDVDDRFKKRDDFGDQLANKNYFRRKLPNEILKIENDLERAKAVYGFIQNSFTWNERYFNYGMNVKEAFGEKTGSVAAINLSLVNALNAANLETKSVLLSTRDNGLPTEHYPVLSNFNYVIAALQLNNNIILLDATNKQAPFGILPFHALNVQGRVMDFKKGSYWTPIEPYKKNIDYANSQISTQPNGNFSGMVKQTHFGYVALRNRNAIETFTLKEYIRHQEIKKAGIEMENYQVENFPDIEKPLLETYDISITPEMVGEKVILQPFFNKIYIDENPFKMKARNYPMDFGFPFTNTYLVSIDLGKVYEIEQLPQNRSIKLQNNDGECSVVYKVENNKIYVRFNMKLNAYRFPPDAYGSLKDFFETMVTMLKEESIILKKI